MGRRSKGYGSRLDRNFGLPPIDRPITRKAYGLYPSGGKGLGEYGSIAFPTVVEAYNRESDYKRWKLGQEYYFGLGRSWGDYEIRALVRFLNNNPLATDELDEAGSKEITTIFPSSSSPEKAWYVGTRTRGSFLLPSAIQAANITLNTSDPDPANHTLVYDVSGMYNAEQIGIYNVCIGDQFEDSAQGPNYPDDLVERDVGSVALTLISVNAASGTLVFDLSTPHVRVQRNGRVYWSRAEYDPAAPLSWKADGTRHLCSSFSFFCCCPDHLGGALANLDQPGVSRANHDVFPLPNANRTVVSAWEREGAGYYRQWRSLSPRRDQRRECKHIHAVRWSCGVPWLEPDDYPTSEDRDWLELAGEVERGFRADEVMEYFRKRRVSWDRFIMTMAESVGLTLFPGGDVRDAVRPSALPLLWNDGTEPLAIWCRTNDWWLERGTQTLRVFNASTGSFQSTITKSGVEYPILSFMDPGEPGAPVAVP
jgi:hypothetical protein